MQCAEGRSASDLSPVAAFTALEEAEFRKGSQKHLRNTLE